ncbi:MAG: TraB/GumN family protein [Novosphingobium sp.]
MIRKLALAVLLALAACKPAPEPPAATPALFEISGPHGEKGWLFGTIHALPQRVDWRGAKIDAAIAAADELVLEIAAIDDQRGLEAEFARRAASPGLPPLLDRVWPGQRDQLAALLASKNIDPSPYRRLETWAAALALAQALKGANDPAFGIDKEILAAAKGKPVGELEGASAQLAVFDTLPEADQRDLLSATVAEALAPDEEAGRLAKAWTRGDMKLLEAETRTGLLADPELRAALLVNRNQAWAAKIAARLTRGGHPFVAVGAAHMAGPDGLPALLAARGYRVTRLQ